MFKSGLLTRESPCKVNKLTQNGYVLTKLPQTQPTPHANHTHRLIIISYFLTWRLVTATLIIDPLINDRFLRLYAKNQLLASNKHSSLSLLKNYEVSMVQSTICIIIQVPIPSLPKRPFLTLLISCKHSCRFSPLRNTGYPMRKLYTIHFGNRPPIKRQGKLPLTQHNITPLLYKTQL